RVVGALRRVRAMADRARGGWQPPNGDDDEGREQPGAPSGWEPPSAGAPSGWEPPSTGAPHGLLPPSDAPPPSAGWPPPPTTPPGWSPPGGQWPAPSLTTPSESNGKATAALVLGILGLVICPLVCSVLALILGYQARREIDASQGRQHNRGVAVAGIVLGWV